MNAETWLTGRRGQTLAVGITCLALAVLWIGIIDPIRAWFNDREMLLEQRQSLLQHMQSLTATLPALHNAATVHSGRADTQGATMLPGATDAVAAADLQERVQKMAADAGISLTAVETLPATQEGKWRRVSLRISMNAPWPVLMDLLRAIDGSPTRILVDDVHFHSATLVTHPAVLPVQASMVLFGFRAAEAGTGT